MSQLTLYHNPGCSKCRGAKEILQAKGVTFDLIEYLQQPLDADQILELLDQLDEEPQALVRKDSHFKELGLDADDYLTRDSVAALLARHPKLMQRPVAVCNGRAVIARPPERIETLL